MNLNARMKEIDARLSEIRKMTNDESDVEKLTNYEKECDSLQEERKSIQAKLSIMDKTNIKPIMVEKNSQDKEMLEKRGIDLKEKRTIVVSSEEILLPSHTDTNLAPVPFAEVSTLVDKVKVVNLNGGETYTKYTNIVTFDKNSTVYVRYFETADTLASKPVILKFGGGN